MAKYRLTICQDDGLTKGWWCFSHIDLRKKYYKCGHCQKEHLLKDGLKNESDPSLDLLEVEE